MAIRTRPFAGLAVLTALALIASGCTLVRRERSADPGPSTGMGTRWYACDDAWLGDTVRPPAVTLQCATVTVPRDWAKPTGDTFDIAVLRARPDRQRERIGSLVVNPGGPGGSGISLATYLSIRLPAEVTRRFDIVGFDPRGVGRSNPVKCFSDADLDRSFGYVPDPVSQTDFDGVVAIATSMGAGCAARYGDTLGLYSTEQAARDMDAVRAAVDDDKITYLGYSYGTLLGATYAQLFPDRVRALVLDGAVDPRLGFIASSESQARGFERAFGNFVDWCADNAGQCPIGPDARAAVTDALDRAKRSPARTPDGRREATDGWIFTAVVASMYAQSSWVSLADALDDLDGGDPAAILQLADDYADRSGAGSYTNLFDSNAAVNCADTDEKITVDQVRRLQSEWRTRYPLFGAPLAIGLLTCALWPGGRDPYPTGPATGAPPIVVVGTIGDPATPYEQTPKLADMLGVGVVLTWQGEGHTAYPETNCVTEAVNAYLISTTVPPTGHTCPAR